MNIVVISNSYPNQSKRYAGHHVAGHVALHRKAGISVLVLSPGESRSGIIFTTRKYLRLGLVVLWTTLTHRFDLVHAHWVLPSGLMGAFLAAVRGKPFVVTSHGAFTNTFDQRSFIVRSLVKFVLAQADRIIAVGKEQQKIIENIIGSPTSSVVCINMGVSIPEKTIVQQEARQQLNLPQDKQIVVFMGNLLKRKGPDLLLRAVALLEEKARLQVYIGGQGRKRAALSAQIQVLGLGDVVKMIGPVRPEEVSTWLGAADICVVPSRTEPFGLVAVEALAAGTPVIAAEVGGLTESIQHGYNGLLFPPGDFETLADRLKQLLADASLRGRLASVARESVRQYDMRTQADKVMEIYREYEK